MLSQKDVYKIPGREGDLILTKEESGFYLCSLPKFTRVGLDEDGSIYFIDPPGGPMILKGMILEDNRRVLDFFLNDDNTVAYIKIDD